MCSVSNRGGNYSRMKMRYLADATPSRSRRLLDYTSPAVQTVQTAASNERIFRGMREGTKKGFLVPLTVLLSGL